MKDREQEIEKIKCQYDIIGDDPKLNLALNKAIQVADSDLSIFITGESGVGKDVFSKIIHSLSDRKHKKLIAVNCGALPEGTIESELFGHKKGSFTGAEKDRKGYFEEADGGTIFLDEVGELPMSMQVKLLRVLENHEILPVGMSEPKKVDVRVVAATNVDIQSAIKAGRFREDLYYRLNQIAIYIPPLRERREDIPMLFRKFASDCAERYKGKMKPILLTEDGREYIKGYPWFGNIRELKNITEQISIVENERNITKAILQNYLNYVPEEKMPAIYQGTHSSDLPLSERELLLKALDINMVVNEMRNEINGLKQIVANLAQSGITPPANTNAHPVMADSFKAIDNFTPHFSDTDNHLRIAPSHQDPIDEAEFQETEVVEDSKPTQTLEEMERKAISEALHRNNGNRRNTAVELGISERTLYRKISDYNIE